MKQVDLLAKCFAVLAIAFGLWVISARFHVGDNAFLAFAFTGVFLLHMYERQKGRTLLLTLCGALGFGLSYTLLGLPFGSFFGAPVIAVGAFLGESSVIVLLGQALWCEERERQQAILRTLLPSLTLVVFVMVSFLCLMATTTYHQQTYDLFLYAFDDSLGFQASFALGRLFEASKPLQNVGLIVYEGLPLAIAFLYAAQLRHRRRSSVNVIRLFMAAGIGGFLLYQFYPASGPVYAFGAAFPAQPPALAQLSLQPVVVGSAPRNAMPSLHAAWGLLLCWNSRRLSRWVQVLTGFVLAVTLLVTVGSGEHYLVDLIVAVPFSLAVQALCTASLAWGLAARRLPFAVGGAMTLGWLAYLRFGSAYFPGSPAVSWSLVAGTLLASALFAVRLDRSASRVTVAPEVSGGHAGTLCLSPPQWGILDEPR